MPTQAQNLKTRLDNAAAELAAMDNTAQHEYVLRVWAEFERAQRALQQAEDPFEIETRGVT